MTGPEDFFPAILLLLLSVWDHIENHLPGAQVLDQLLDGAQLDVTERLQVLTLIQGGHFPLLCITLPVSAARIPPYNSYTIVVGILSIISQLRTDLNLNYKFRAQTHLLVHLRLSYQLIHLITLHQLDIQR